MSSLETKEETQLLLVDEVWVADGGVTDGGVAVGDLTDGRVTDGDVTDGGEAEGGVTDGGLAQRSQTFFMPRYYVRKYRPRGLAVAYFQKHARALSVD